MRLKKWRCRRVYKHELIGIDSSAIEERIVEWLKKKRAKDIFVEGSGIIYFFGTRFSNYGDFSNINYGKILIRQKKNCLQIFLIIYPKITGMILTLFFVLFAVLINPILIIGVMICLLMGVLNSSKNNSIRFGNFLRNL